MGNMLVVSMERLLSSPYHVVMLGLDNSGKTTMLYKTKLKENIHSHPTMSFNVECVSVTKKLKFKIWDIGGREANRPLWKAYVRRTQGMIFVVDSVDQSRLEEARHELFNLLNSESAQLNEVPILVMANKQDSVGALSPDMIAKELRLNEMSNKHLWHVEASTSYVGDGFNEGLKTLGKMIAFCNGETPKDYDTGKESTTKSKKDVKSKTNAKRKPKKSKPHRRNSTSSREGILI